MQLSDKVTSKLAWFGLIEAEDFEDAQKTPVQSVRMKRGVSQSIARR
jgi:hypothetical protein